MRPDLLALARAYVALPGAPRLLATLGDGAVWVRSDDTGVCWCWDTHESRWLPDLTDDATGGILLCHLPPGWLVYQRAHDGRWEVGRPDGEHRQEGSTLAEACARVAVALGRAA